MFEYKLTLNRVYDKVRIIENDQKLILTVNTDAMRLVAGLMEVQKDMAKYGEMDEQQKMDIARRFAGVIFGDEQTKQLEDFYHGDAGCIVSVCGKYFSERLNKRIIKAQKKSGTK